MRVAVMAVLLACLAGPAMADIAARPWGVTADDGRPANLYTLTIAHGMTTEITNYGGVVVSLTAPDRQGRYANVVQGFGSLGDYTSADYIANHGHYGAIIGRFANRIKGAGITLDGNSYRLDPERMATSTRAARWPISARSGTRAWSMAPSPA